MIKRAEMVQAFLSWEREDFSESPRAFLSEKSLPYESDAKGLVETHPEADLRLASFSNMGFIMRELHVPAGGIQTLCIDLCPCGHNFKAVLTSKGKEKVLRTGCGLFTFLE